MVSMDDQLGAACQRGHIDSVEAAAMAGRGLVGKQDFDIKCIHGGHVLWEHSIPEV